MYRTPKIELDRVGDATLGTDCSVGFSSAEFFNSIGTYRTCRQPRVTAAYRSRADSGKPLARQIPLWLLFVAVQWLDPTVDGSVPGWEYPNAHARRDFIL